MFTFFVGDCTRVQTKDIDFLQARDVRSTVGCPSFGLYLPIVVDRVERELRIRARTSPTLLIGASLTRFLLQRNN